MAPRSVLIDATPVLDHSGNRGIGRFIIDLLRGLADTQQDWADELTIRTVVGLGRGERMEITGDLSAAVATLIERRGSELDQLIWRRRAYLGLAAVTSDLVHITEALGTPLLLHPRTVVTCYDMILLRMPRQYLEGKLSRIAKQGMKDFWRYHRARRVVAISQKTADDLAKILYVSPDRIDVVPLGIDQERWSAERTAGDDERLRAWSLADKPYVLFVGFGDYRKGVDAMMRTLATLRRKRDVELVWAGHLSARDRQMFLREAYAAGVAPHVRFMGFVSDAELGTLYRGAFAHLFLSKLEGFGLSVAEAVACGCPVVVVRGSGADEVCGPAGYAVAPDDYEAAAHALELLSERPDERARRVAEGLTFVRRFDRRNMARGYVESWRRTLAPAARAALVR